MKDKFQYILLGAFVLIAIIGVVMFAGSGKNKKGTDGVTGTVVMWGTMPASLVQKTFSDYTSNNETYGITYQQKSKETFENDIIEALASGKGPDMFLITPENLWHLRDKISEFPYETFPQRTFLDGYINGADIFLSGTGVLAIPYRIDPMVMYYNKPMLESHFVIAPPMYWDDMYAFSQAVTVKDQNGIISDSAVALGAWDNVDHAKDIVATLLLQSGVTITKLDGSTLDATLNKNAPGSSVLPAQSVVTFYSEFANPVSLYYSWNEAKTDSLDAFVAGDLALYFGYASELPTIRSKNPNLDFDVAMMPQVESVQTKAVYGDMYAVAISKFSKNPITAQTVAREITEKSMVEDVAQADYATPMLKSLLATRPSDDPYRSIFYQSALIAKSWVDPDSTASNNVFRTMIKSYTSGASDARKAVDNAHGSLELLTR